MFFVHFVLKKNIITMKPKENLVLLIMRLAELGLDENEIAYSLCLTKRKFSALMEQKEISDALEKGLEVRARRVEDALYRRAVGFEYEEVVTSEKPKTKSLSPSSPYQGEVPAGRRGPKGKCPPARGTSKQGEEFTGGVKEASAKSTIKTVIPDVTACIFWLKNTLPDKWRDPKDILSGKKSFQELIEAYDEEEETE